VSAIVRIRAWLELIPIIIAAVRAIEAAMPENGLGAAKLAAIRMAIEAAFDGVSDALGAFSDVWPRIERIVAGIVASLNATGVFRKGGA
jgi:mannose/fructose/N-acetylgalactosamine-specific phosphotransferase system component IID